MILDTDKSSQWWYDGITGCVCIIWPEDLQPKRNNIPNSDRQSGGTVGVLLTCKLVTQNESKLKGGRSDINLYMF